MRAMKILGGLIALLLAAVVVAPFLVNVNQYKGLIAQECSKRLGREVRIDGDVKLSFLPCPRLSLEKVVIAAPAHMETQALLLAIPEASATIGWASLWERKAVISSVNLDDPVVHFVTTADGSNNWTFEIPAASEPQTEPTSGARSFDVRIEQLKIKDGTMIYSAPHSPDKALHHLNLKLAAQSLDGPFDLSGDVEAFDEAVDFKVKAGQRDTHGLFPFEATVDCGAQKVQHNGAFDLNKRQLSGRTVVQLRAPSAASELLGSDLIILETNTLASPDRIQLPDLSVAVKGERLQGEVALDLQTSSLNGHLSGLFSDLVIKAKSTNIQGPISLEAQLGDPKKLCHWLEIDTDSLPEALLAQKMTLTVDAVPHATEGMRFEQLHLRTGGRELKGSLAWKAPRLTLDLTAPQGREWAALWGLDVASSDKPCTVSGHLEDQSEMLAFDMQGQFLGAHLATQGTWKSKAQKFDAHLKGTHNDGNALLRAFHSPQDSLKLGSLGMVAHLSGTPQAVAIHAMTLTLHPKSAVPIVIGGHAALGTKKVLRLTADIDTLPWDEMQPHTAASTPTGQARWSDQPLNLSFLQDWDAQIDLKIKRVTGAKADLRDLVLPIKVGKGRLDATLQGRFFEGPVQGTVSLTSPGLLEAQLHVQKARMDQLLQAYHISQLSGGQADLELRVIAAGKSPHAWVNSLEGDLNLEATGGHLSGALFGFAKDLDLGALLGASGSKKTDMLRISAPLSIRAGVVNLDKIEISTPLGAGHAKGTINLPRWTLESTVTIDAQAMGLDQDIVLRASGSLDNPQTRFSGPSLSAENLQKTGTHAIATVVDQMLPGAGAVLGQFVEPQRTEKKDTAARPQKAEAGAVTAMVDKMLPGAGAVLGQFVQPESNNGERAAAPQTTDRDNRDAESEEEEVLPFNLQGLLGAL